MHTAAFRANALLTYAGTALAVLAALASVTGAPSRCVDATGEACVCASRLRRATDLWHKETPVLDARLVKVERLHALDSGNDEAR